MILWKAPNRPKHEITQPFNDGIVKIYTVQNSAPPGYKPVETETLLCTLRYEERTVGINRFYTAKQNMVEIEKVLRVPDQFQITTQDVAITEDGQKYRIDQIQRIRDVYPVSLDLALYRESQGVQG